MITKEDIFNDKSVNIFTDASIMQLESGEYVGCPGFVTTYNGDIINYGYDIHRNSTNNNAEIKAVRMGVVEATKYQDLEVRLFSDSQICIFGLRERIYKWVNRSRDGTLIGYDKKPIKNQDIFTEIVNYILWTNTKVQFFHQRGHINLLKQTDLIKARDDFIKFNNIQDTIDLECIEKICYFNNYVDVNTRRYLNLNFYDGYRGMRDAVKFYYNSGIDIDKYKQLTKN